MRRCGRGDYDGIGPGVEHGFDPPRFPSDLPRHLFGTLRIGVADEYLVHSGVAGQHTGVEGADTASSEQSDFHPTLHSSTPSREPSSSLS